MLVLETMRVALAAIRAHKLRSLLTMLGIVIGLIGSRRKTRVVFSDLRAAGVAEALLERVHTPVGLPIGAVTVPEIAVSIAAELIEHRRRITPKLIEGPAPGA